jgi:Ca2+-binding RTX toxin-like protein
MADSLNLFSTTIAVSGARDLVFDEVRGLLYITTADGNVERYDIATRTLLTAIDAGNQLNGADITADGSTLYVAEGTRSASQGFVRKIDLNTGEVDNVAYDLDFAEGGAWDISIGATGKAVVTTIFEGSGWTPLRELDLATDTYSILTAGSGFADVRGGSRVHRSADRSLFLVTEPNISSGPLFTYDPATETFPGEKDTGTFLGNIGAVNRDGSLVAAFIANSVAVMTPQLTVVENVGSSVTGIAFDPTRDILYVTDTDELIAYDTDSFEELYRMNVGAILSSASFFTFQSTVTVSDDGNYAFVANGSTVQMLELPELGTAGDDVYVGLGTNDIYMAFAGNDDIAGNGGSDVLDGGAGSDTVMGGVGNDRLSGGDGGDRLFGEDGSDTIDGGGGHDVLNGGAGKDTLFGGAGTDTVLGGAKNDVLAGDDGDDCLRGEDGWDSLLGGTGRDYLNGGTGNDTMIGGDGKDTIIGGAGDVMSGDERADIFKISSFDFYSISGGLGADTIVFKGAGFDVDLQLFDDVRITDVECMDIRGNGVNELTVAASDVTAMSSTSNLLVLAGEDDIVTLVGDWELLEVPYYGLYMLGSASVLISAEAQVEISL